MASPMLKFSCCARNVRNCIKTSKTSQCLFYSSERDDDRYTSKREKSQFNLDYILDDSAPSDKQSKVTSLLHDDIETEVKQASSVPQKSFATLLRESKFMQLGDLSKKLVTGRIFEVQGDDLYIDFGGKFYCVCTRPAFQAGKYNRGTKVKLMINKFEMTSSFLGSEKHITLLEADCTLLGLYESAPVKGERTESTDDSNSAEKTVKIKPGGLAGKFMKSLEEQRTNSDK